MYRVLSVEGGVIVLANTDGHVKRVDRSSFSFDPKLGDRVDLFYDENDEVIATRAKIEERESGSRAIRSALLQGIFDLFTEVLSIHNEQVGNLKKILSQLFIAFFMVWALIGVVVVELVILLESLLLLAYQALLVAIKSIRDFIAKKISEREERQARQDFLKAYAEPIYERDSDQPISPEAYDSEDDGFVIDLDSLELAPDDAQQKDDELN